jgi:hypothetical protein
MKDGNIADKVYLTDILLKVKQELAEKTLFIPESEIPMIQVKDPDKSDKENIEIKTYEKKPNSKMSTKRIIFLIALTIIITEIITYFKLI